MTAPSTTTTKSIDVGSMFLMDISVHESEPDGDLLSNDSTITLDESDSSIFTSSDLKLSHQNNKTYKLNSDISDKSVYGKASKQSIGYHSSKQQQLGIEYLSNSLDRIANAIEADEGHYKSNKSPGGIIKIKTNTVTIVEPLAPPEVAENQSSSSSSSSSSPSQSTSSLSDESFVASSATSFTESSGEENEHDITDLVGSHSDDKYEQINGMGMGSRNDNKNRSVQQQRPISKNITATNLIKSANNNHNKSSKSSGSNNNDPNRSYNKPTNNSNHYHYHHHDYSHRSQSKRSVSASLPIQVPARQMKKDLNKLKLGLKNNNLQYNNVETITTTKITTPTTSTTSSTETDPIDVGDSKSSSYSNRAHQHDNQSAMSVAFDDFDEFLDQEYNDNHHNHYPIDEYDEENLRAEENPMKLFESIQALARSLHEDTELFGSLPPKRMLESPIRSLALV